MTEHPLQCPLCHVEMSMVSIQAHYGERILIDQCPNCGGIWFDADELYRVRPSEIVEINDLDTNQIGASQLPIGNEPLVCPRDGRKLIIFHDANFPKCLVVEFCPVCSGYWFNRGEFTQLEKIRKEKTEMSTALSELPPALSKEIDALLDSHSNKGTYDVLNAIAKFLSSPVDTSIQIPNWH